MGCTKLGKDGKNLNFFLKKFEKKTKISYFNRKINSISYKTSLIAKHQMCPKLYVTSHYHHIPCHFFLPPYPISFIAMNIVPSNPAIKKLVFSRIEKCITNGWNNRQTGPLVAMKEASILEGTKNHVLGLPQTKKRYLQIW